MKKLLLALFAMLVAARQARAQEPSVDLYAVQQQVVAIKEMATENTITVSQAEEGVARILDRAEASLGRPVTEEELTSVQGPTVVAVELTWLQRAAGLVTFTNTLIALAVIVGVVAFLYLCGRGIMALVEAFAEIPATVYESLLVVSGVGLTAYATQLPEAKEWSVGLIGALLYGGGFFWIAVRHEALKLTGSAVGIILAVAWGVSAVLFDSALIGALSVAGLMAAFGFSAFMMPGLIAVGFKDDDSVPRATLAAFAVLAAFVGLEITGQTAGVLSVFRIGSLYLCGFVGYLGLLTIASRWYGTDVGYLLRQLPMLLAGPAALYLGSVLGIPELQKIGGTFFVLYLLEKPFEIPAQSMTVYAAIVLAVCAVIYGGATWASGHLDLIAPYLLFV